MVFADICGDVISLGGRDGARGAVMRRDGRRSRRTLPRLRMCFYGPRRRRRGCVIVIRWALPWR